MNANERKVVLMLVVAQACHAGSIVSRDWANGKLTLKLDDGNAEIEWISPVSFRVSRTWGNAPAPSLRAISHEKIGPEFIDVGQTMTMKTRYLTFEIDRGDMSMHVRSGDTEVSNSTLALESGKIALHLNIKSDERVFGAPPFLFTSKGYGLYVRSGEHYALGGGKLSAEWPTSAIDYVFYYGPTPKEIFEQHAITMGLDEVKSNALDLLTRAQLPKQATIVKSAANVNQFVAELIQRTLSGVIYPAVDLAEFENLRGDARQRLKDLCTMLPIVFRSSGEGGIDAAIRMKWRPYLITYLREAFDRGYPLIRPLPMQFSKDANTDKQSDVFMLGDEVLLAPTISSKRKLSLPRGTWTDLRTNAEYRGNQTIEVDSPTGRVPTFVRNGWIVPLEMKDTMELHYFPSLGGEFFLWEPDQGENSQFHAAPAGDYMRVEVETKVRRTYEWVIHHTKAPKEVAEESGAYQHVAKRELLQPGMWWHDAALNNLHLMMRAEANTDRIVNMSF
jgi:hypothetical protein